MKQFLQQKTHPFKEAPQCSTNDSSMGAAKPKPSPRKQLGPSKHSKENCPPFPADVNSPSPSPASKMKSLLPPRPPSNPLKRKLCLDPAPESSSSDSGVQVVVRMRPLNNAEEDGVAIINKISDHSVSISGHTFTFDSVADTDATQQDVFNLVGAPLVENCLAGFNSSVFAYGQTGSGKTYTMWGPANALSEENLNCDKHGLTPRVFQKLFSRIDEEQAKHADMQLSYNCRCSFLEIYNEQITDLLDPNQKNLQIREDVNTGVYVENLREEFVFSMKDVMHLLTKGLSNRRTGATSINSESSRSHSVFTCVVECRCKKKLDGISSVKTSRINLVDLAGSERQKLTGAGGERLKEAGNINRSLSQLGNLINILAEVSQTGKQRHIPYRDSRLTFLLQESLGGNAKLAMLCAVSPSISCKNETFSTLRFAQRAKAIKNKAIVNEETEDDVNHLREIIRQLRDELHNMKANGGNSSGWNARKSLILLKSLVNPRLRLHELDEDGDEEMEIDEEAVEQNSNELNLQPTAAKIHVSEGLEADMHQEKLVHDGCGDRTSQKSVLISPEEANVMNSKNMPNMETATGEARLDDPSSEACTILKSPTQSVSPRVSSSSRKSLRTFSMSSASQRISFAEKVFPHLDANQIAKSMICSSNAAEIRNRQGVVGQTDRLAASLHRGLEILDNHRKSSVLRRSSFRFFVPPLDSKPPCLLHRADAGVQTLFTDEGDAAERSSCVFLCGNCKRKAQDDLVVVDDDSGKPKCDVTGESEATIRPKVEVPKAVEKVLAGAIRREMALEEFCGKQASEIFQLNRLVQQYKYERECNAVIGKTREDKILRLESLMDGALSSEEYLEEELNALAHENHLLKEKCENHPDVSRLEIELHRAQKEVEQYKNFFELGEKDVLQEEIQDLRSQLSFYLDSSAQKKHQQPKFVGEKMETIEEERTRWTELESKWISLVDELKSELDSYRMVAEKQRRELDTEKRCGEELNEAMQMAMHGHARLLEQYADLEEKHIDLLARHRMIQDGIADVKKAASKAGVRGAESKFINALAAEITALKLEREKERRFFRDENRGLQVQLRDTAEAVQAAGELLVRLKEAEEAVSSAQKRALEAEKQRGDAIGEMEAMKNEISTLKALLEDSRLPKEAVYSAPVYDGYAAGEKELEPSNDDEFSKLPEPSSWFSGYDRCNI